MSAVLDNPVYHSLVGAHARFAETSGRAVRYQADVSPFAAFPGPPQAADWGDALALARPALAFQHLDEVAAGWTVERRLTGVQMVLSAATIAPTSGDIEVLGPDDVDQMLALVGHTRPGPFERRTRELGRYVGVRAGGELVAMAGERMRPPGWTEVSAVCTAPGHRGKGLARRVIAAVIAGIQARGDRPFLHVAAENAGAIALYESIGFEVRRTFTLTVVSPAARTRA